MQGIGDASGLVEYEGPVYHYTSSQGLLGIVDSGTFRASEASSLNDLAEVELGWRAIRRWVSGQPKSKGVTYLKKLLKGSVTDPKHQVFILSGTTLGDDANQWRLYADGGRGYAIELDGSAALGVVSGDGPVDREDMWAYSRVSEFVYITPWHQVIYSRHDLEQAVSAVAKYAEASIQDLDAVEDEEELEHLGEVLRDELFEELSRIAHLYKTKGFGGEREVRVVARLMWFGHHVGFRAGAYGIAGHLRLVTSAETSASAQRVVPAPEMENAGSTAFRHPLAITSVRMGPLVHKGNRETLMAFLTSKGLRSAAVTRSKVPLR